MIVGEAGAQDGSRLELQPLRYFVEVAGELRLAEAAEQLGFGRRRETEAQQLTLRLQLLNTQDAADQIGRRIDPRGDAGRASSNLWRRSLRMLRMHGSQVDVQVWT